MKTCTLNLFTVLRTTAALRDAARTQNARHRCRLCCLVGRRWLRRRRFDAIVGRTKPVGTAKSAPSGTGKGEFDAKMRLGSQSERPRAPDQALTRGNLSPRCEKGAPGARTRIDSVAQGAKREPQEVAPSGTRSWTTGALVKPHFSKKVRLPCRRELHPTIWPKRTQRKV